MTELAANMVIRSFSEDDRNDVVALWQRCGLVVPQNDPNRDIDLKMKYQGDLFLVGLIKATAVATVMAGYDGHRGWIYYLAVDPSLQGKGLGRRIMAEAETRLIELGCPKINLMIRDTNLGVQAFYEAIGYEKQGVVVYGKRLIPDP